MLADHNTSSASTQDLVEEWRFIVGCEHHQVSTLGRIRSRLGHGRSKILSPTWHFIKPWPNNRGYMMIRLRRDGKLKSLLVHRLVLEAFVGPCPEGMEARHANDNNKQDNRLSNLTWGTRLENVDDKIRHGTQVRGSRCWKAKLTDSSVKEIFLRWKAGERQCKLAQEFGIFREHVYKIVSGQIWLHVTGDL